MSSTTIEIFGGPKDGVEVESLRGAEVLVLSLLDLDDTSVYRLPIEDNPLPPLGRFRADWHKREVLT